MTIVMKVLVCVFVFSRCQASPVDQIEFYCKTIEDLREPHPYVAASIENCALEAVPLLCQVGLYSSVTHGSKTDLWIFDQQSTVCFTLTEQV